MSCEAHEHNKNLESMKETAHLAEQKIDSIQDAHLDELAKAISDLQDSTVMKLLKEAWASLPASVQNRALNESLPEKFAKAAMIPGLSGPNMFRNLARLIVKLGFVEAKEGVNLEELSREPLIDTLVRLDESTLAKAVAEKIDPRLKTLIQITGRLNAAQEKGAVKLDSLATRIETLKKNKVDVEMKHEHDAIMREI